MKAGVVGLGLAGKAVAACLLDRGVGVVGFDIAPDAVRESVRMGVEPAPDPREVAKQANRIVLSLLTSEDRRNLLWGEQAMAEALRPGTIVLDTTTGRPQDAREDAIRLRERGVHWADVCLIGSSEMIRRREAVALVGDSEERGQEYRRLICAFSKAQFYFGSPGRGNEAKLIANLVIGLNRLVLAEALGLAAKNELDLWMLLEALKAGAAYSAVMDAKGEKMVARAYDPPAARLAQHAKDVGLILEYAHEAGASVPLSELHDRIIRDLVAQGFGAMDNAAIFEAYCREQPAG